LFFTDRRGGDLSLRILVTGGTGFVGQNLVRRLLKEGHQVTVTSTGSESKIPNVHKVLYATLEGIDWKCVYGQDVVVHLMANNDTLCSDEEEMMRANLYGPIKLFSSAYDGGCRKFVYASSTAVYGDSPAPYNEKTEVAPLNVYGESKAKFDEFAMIFANEKSVPITGFRFCNIYGPGEEKKGKRMSMIGQLLRQMKKDMPLTLFKDGEQRRDWVHVNDVVQAITLAIGRSSMNHGEIYNLGSGASYTFNEVAQTVHEEYVKTHSIKKDVQINYIDCPFPDKYQSYTECDIEKARIELGYYPGFNLRSGVRQYVENL
jgi:ADP-L-glycero-D-manno-heptose 6-epimerase